MFRPVTRETARSKKRNGAGVVEPAFSFDDGRASFEQRLDEMTPYVLPPPRAIDDNTKMHRAIGLNVIEKTDDSILLANDERSALALYQTLGEP